MGVFQNNLMGAAAAAASAGGNFYTHQIANSVRIPATSSTSSSNGRLTRTFSTVDSSVHWTLNFWIKRSALEGTNPVTSARPLTWFTPRSSTSGSVLQEFKFCSPTNAGSAGDSLVITNTNSNNIVLTTDNLFRDTSAWYNIHIQADLDNGTNSERLKFFINGTEASYNTDNRGSYTSLPGITAGAWTIGDYYNYGYPIQCYFAQWAYVDGTTLAPTVFAEEKNGVWIPKDLSSGITWGSAGHLLNFESSSDLGNDSSGNNNDWTSSNLAAHDQMLDSPTNNFPTFNPLTFNTAAELPPTENNCMMKGADAVAKSGNPEQGNLCTMGVRSGKWYWEVKLSGGGATTSGRGWSIGISSTPDLNFSMVPSGGPRAGRYDNGYAYSGYSGTGIYHDNSITSYGSAPADDDIIGMALDLSTPGSGSLTVYKNGSSLGVAVNGSIADAQWIPYVGLQGGLPSGYDATVNFGQDGTFAGLETAQGNSDANGYGNFYYSVPTGYLAMCSQNLPLADEINPAETDDNYPQKLFGAAIWTGDGNNSRAITGLGFQPDWLWFKSRSSAFSNRLYDTSRGISSTGGKRLFSNTTAVENDQTSGQDISAVGTDGFTTGASSANYNNDTNSGGLNVGWFWRANGGTTSTNTQGDTNSTVQVDPSGHFSIVLGTGDNDNWGNPQTFGHGLSAAPNFIIGKKRTDNADEWQIFFSDYGNATIGGSNAASNSLVLNSNAALYTNQSYKGWGGVMPTSTVFTLDGNNLVQNGDTFVCYCFANCEGYIKSGAYTGNGDADGTFVYTGFRPALVTTKRVDGSSSWLVHDDARNTYNVTDKILTWDDGQAEFSGSNDKIDILANGFKVRSSNAGINGSDNDYVYLAMARNPFKYATAR